MKWPPTTGRACLRERVGATSTHAPLGGIERDGWKLVYTDKPNVFTQALEKLAKFADFAYSLGFSVSEDGKIGDVMPGSPGYVAGLGPRNEVDCRQRPQMESWPAARCPEGSERIE